MGNTFSGLTNTMHIITSLLIAIDDSLAVVIPTIYAPIDRTFLAIFAVISAILRTIVAFLIPVTG